MDQNMNMGTPMPEEKKPTGAIISITVIVLVIVLGAYYFLKQVPLPAEESAGTPASATEQTDTTVSALSAQGTSTDIVDIQKDLNATNLSGLDAGLNNVAI